MSNSEKDIHLTFNSENVSKKHGNAIHQFLLREMEKADSIRDANTKKDQKEALMKVAQKAQMHQANVFKQMEYKQELKEKKQRQDEARQKLHKKAEDMGIDIDQLRQQAEGIDSDEDIDSKSFGSENPEAEDDDHKKMKKQMENLLDG